MRYDLLFGLRRTVYHLYYSSGTLARHHENIVRAIEKFYPKTTAKFKTWTKKNPPGSPLVVVICMSAKRCALLLKSLSKFKLVAKLFAKHMKLKDQIEKLSTQRAAIAIGTPNRLGALAAAGALVRTGSHATQCSMYGCTFQFLELSSSVITSFVNVHYRVLPRQPMSLSTVHTAMRKIGEYLMNQA